MIFSRRSRYQARPRGKYYRINLNITAPTVRVLDETGKQIGVFTKEEAYRRARTQGLDLVEIAPLAKPPVCKIIDFKKFRYLESKKERESKKKTKNVDIKEIVLSPFIDNHDFEIKTNKGRQFLKDNNKLKVTVKFKGRQLGKKEFGFERVNRLIKELEDISKVEKAPKFEGKILTAQLSPVKKTINQAYENEIENPKVYKQALPSNQVRETHEAQAKRAPSSEQQIKKTAT